MRVNPCGKSNRREFLGRSLGFAAAGLWTVPLAAESSASEHGHLVGEPTAEKVGAQILSQGGNAVDAIVAAALAAAVAAPGQTGIGGYGGSATLAIDGGRRIVSLDFNSTAPAAARHDMFRPGPDGRVPGRVNELGWLAAGVPGILAGLQLALDRFGTRRFGEVVQPAIALARDGFPASKGLAGAIRNNAAQFEKDPGSRRLFFPHGNPLAAGERFRNPELAEMLSALATANSVEAFYRGSIARHIAEAFRKNGGLVTTEDLAAYRARVVEPLALSWDASTIHTAPLTAGGLSTLQAFAAMKAMRWDKLPTGLARTHARVEAMRLAWRDRLTLLGDPDFAKVPVARLLSDDYARECAQRIESVVKAGKFLAHAVTANPQTGTINLSAADKQGNFAALTLTHGGGFGARVTVEGLGLTLGHGMSRFAPTPGHPNSPGPGKRPLNNMVPTIVTRDGRPVLAVGGSGGRRIPNAMFELLTHFVVLRRPLGESIAAPRMHTEGGTTLEFEKSWPPEEVESLGKIGYTVKTGPSATLSAVAMEDGQLRPAMR